MRVVISLFAGSATLGNKNLKLQSSMCNRGGNKKASEQRKRAGLTEHFMPR